MLCEEIPNEEITESFADLLLVLYSVDFHFDGTQELKRGICITLKRYIKNEKLCSKLIRVLKNTLEGDESKIIIH